MRRKHSGKQGVRWNVRRMKWQVHIRRNGSRRVLGYFDDLEQAIAVRKRAEEQVRADKRRNTAKLAPEQKQSFYRSRPWRRLRMDILERDNGRCRCCGASANDGARLHVDHIIPISKRPDLRLEPNNLQVMCEECNLGKGNRYRTNWRGTTREGETIKGRGRDKDLTNIPYRTG